ncbi:unnamed protein product, partial [Polarella glacialis]
AAQSADPDLIHGVIAIACGGDPCGRSVDVQALVRLVKERPQELQVISEVFAATLQQGEQFDRARMFHEQLGRRRDTALTAVQQVFRKREAEERTKWLRFAKDFFGMVDSAVSEAERASMQFCAQASAEESELLKAQIVLEEQSVTKRWLNGPHRFTGLSLVDTLCKLIEIGEIVEADNLHTQMKVSDKRYWRMKVRALSNCGNLSELNMMATHRTSPIGYELIIEAFLKHGRNELALPFIPKVKTAEQQAMYYSRMGMDAEAQAALTQRQERSGAGRLLSNILRLG